MKTQKLRLLLPTRFALAFAVLTVLLTATPASAQCTEVISGLRDPLGTALTNQGNLLVSETGTASPNSGRISILDAGGNRRTLLDGLPSAINDVGEPSGPAGLFMRGRTLYIAHGSWRRWPGRADSRNDDPEPRGTSVTNLQLGSGHSVQCQCREHHDRIYAYVGQSASARQWPDSDALKRWRR